MANSSFYGNNPSIGDLILGEEALSGAIAAKLAAEAAASEAEASADIASASLDLIYLSANIAIDAATLASSAAAASALSALDRLNGAIAAQHAAENSANAATAQAVLASEWASKTTGPVAGAEYSAKSWAIDAQAFRNTALTYRNDAQAYRDTALTHRNDASGFRNEALQFRNDASNSAVLAATFTPANFVLKAGDTLTGKLVTATPTTSIASINLPHGVAPTTPANGDLWTTSSAGLQTRINGTTVTAHTSANMANIAQAEAQAGSATTNRAWTALRVRENVAAYAAPIAHTHNGTDITFTARPTFAGNVPWDAGNFTPGNYFTKTEADTRFVVPANRILNSTFKFNNRSAANADNGMAVDRWITYNQVSSAIIRGVHTAGVSPYGSVARLRQTVITPLASLPAAAWHGCVQSIEGTYLQDAQLGTAQCKPLLLRFGVRCSVAGTFGVNVGTSDGSRMWVGTYTIAAGEVNTDVIRNFVIPPTTTGTFPKDANAGLVLRFPLAIGSTYQGAAGWNNSNVVTTSAQTNLAATAGATWDLFDVGLYVDQQGTGVIPPFEAHEYHAEATALLRYFRWAPVDVRAYSPGASYYLGGTATLSPPMRVAPTAGAYGVMPGATGSGGSVVTTLSVGFLSPHHISYYWLTTTAGDAYALGFGVPLSAEL